jgi:hypothetical protein
MQKTAKEELNWTLNNDLENGGENPIVETSTA